MSARTSTHQYSRFSELSRKPFFKFFERRSGPFDSVVLDRSRVYILPTKAGVLFCLLLLLLMIGSVNYGKSLGYMLTFMLVGVGNVAMVSIWRNLAGLRLSKGGGMPMFAGQETTFAVKLEHDDTAARYSITSSHNGKEFEVIDVPANSVAQIHFKVRSKQRGYLRSGRFRLYTTYPTGLFVAWTWIELNMSALVYPAPAVNAEMPAGLLSSDGDAGDSGTGLEEFSGLRDYQKGDSWRRVSWKASARNQTVLTKEFAGAQPDYCWIDWDLIKGGGVEQRLSQMTRLVIDAEAAHRVYGLRLPGIELPPDHGSQHYHQCLKALATHAI